MNIPAQDTTTRRDTRSRALWRCIPVTLGMVTAIGCATPPHYQRGAADGVGLPPIHIAEAGSRHGGHATLTGALVIDRTMGGVAPEVQDHMLHALVYIGLGDHQEALSHYQMALERARQLGNAAGEAKALMNIGVLHHEHGQYTESLAYLARALERTRAMGNAAGEAKAIEYIDVVYDRLGQYVAALSTTRAR